MQAKIESSLKLSLFSLGFTSLFTQIYAIREFMSVLNGNELILGFVLASWMVLTALGAMSGKLFLSVKKNLNFLLFLQFLLAVLPVLTLVKLDLWKAFVIPPGSMISIAEATVTTLVILAPFCLINGFLFVAYTIYLSELNKDNSFGRSYSLESIGSMAAGIIVNFLLLWIFDNWTGVILLMSWNFLVLFLLLWKTSKKIFALIFIAVSTCLLILVSFLDLKEYTDELLFPGQKPLVSRMTPYGKVVITEGNGQLNIFENGVLLFSSGNEIRNEEAVHFLSVHHSSPENILLVSGGLSGIADEFLKYHPQRIDYFELNPALISSWKALFRKDFDKRIRVIEMDARRFLNATIERYDLCLINLPDPSTLQINRFYTAEFFRLLKSRMNPGGYISLGLPATMDYVSEEANHLNSVIFQTLKKSFREVRILPGQRNYFIASDSLIRTDITTIITPREIETKYVNHYYLEDDWLKNRSEFITGQITETKEINTDLRPVGFYLQIKYWISFFGDNTGIIMTVIIVVLIMLGFLLNSVNTGLFISGFTASSVELMILMIIQATYGYIFQVAGLVITLFMGGLAAGAWFQPRIRQGSLVNRYIHLLLTTSVFCLGLPFLLMMIDIRAIPDAVSYFILAVATIFIAVITGMEFSVASSLSRKNISSFLPGNYAAELTGSALGMVITTLLFLPLLGLMISSLALVLMNLTGAVFLAFNRKKL